jgi:hypothetical protein
MNLGFQVMRPTHTPDVIQYSTNATFDSSTSWNLLSFLKEKLAGWWGKMNDYADYAEPVYLADYLPAL